MQVTARPSFLILLSLACLGWQTVLSATKADYYNLYDYLFEGKYYKKQIRPANNLDDPLVVTMSFYLLAILDVNEKQQMLETSARLEMIWDDDYLEWNSTEYGGIEEILVPQNLVYVPDIVLSNSVSTQEQLGYANLPVRLSSIGVITWEPTVYLATDCDIDITYFPFETQECSIEFETAVSRSTEIDIDIMKGTSAIFLPDFSQNGQWDLVDTFAENLSDEGGKTKIRFKVVIERRRTFYVMNIILPVFFLSLTASLVFAIPADEGEKMGTGITVLLAFAVYLTIVSDLIPNTSLQVSVLGLYLTILLGLSALSVIICVFNLRLHHRDVDKPVGPKTTCIIRFFRFILCIKETDEDAPSSNQVTPTRPRSAMSDNRGVDLSMRSQVSLSKSAMGGRQDPRMYQNPRLPPAMAMTEESEEKMTWQLVAETMDWLCFIIFTMATLLVTIICLLYLHFGSISDAPSL